MVEGFHGERILEGDTFGRVWRLFVKPWGWPYARHEYGVLCVGIGPIGFMLFDLRRLNAH
jgi:hypothetical protein